MALTETRKGEVYIFLETLLWSCFPVITALSYSHLPSLVSLAASSAFAALFFLVLVIARKRWKEMLSPQLWKYILITTLLMGVVFYALYFIGLESTTPGNAALIAELEIFTTFVMFHLFRGEHLPREHVVGLFSMLLGACIVLAPNVSSFRLGDFLIFAAICLAPVGNFYTQRARKIASSETIMFLRSFLAVPAVLALAFLLGQHASVLNVRSSILYLAINGVLLLGLSKILWIESIHRISITKAVAINGVTPLLTILIAWALLKQVPTVWQLSAFIPLMFGIVLLTNQLKLSSKLGTSAVR